MRNLKRVLSLAIASVMLLGMMVVGTSAANYPDVDAQDNLEAIEVLKAVGVMTGDENGNFNPDAKVTRNEMAVVMVNLLGLKAGGTSPFTDVPAWAQPYVNACYVAGVTGGISATQYGGSNTVTAAEAALMTMKPLGYFGYQGEFGDDWKVATIARATKIDLFGDLDLYADEALTRNDVAQLVLNALESNVAVVTEQGGMSVEGNGITVNQKPTYSVVYAADKAGHDYNSVDDGTLQLAEKLFGSKLKKNGDSQDDFGRPATEWTYKSDSIKTPKAAAATYTTTVKEKDVYKTLGLKTDATCNDVYVNGQDTTTVTVGKNSTADIGAKGTVTEFYMNSNRTIKAVVQYNYFLAQATADYNETDEELIISVKATGNFASTLKAEDFAIANYKEDDFIILTAATTNGTDYTIKSIAPAVVESGLVVSEYKDDNYVVAGGKTYNYNAAALADDDVSLGQDYMDGEATYSTQSTKYDLVLDPNGYVIGVQPTTSEKVLEDYLLVLDAEKVGFQYLAKVLFMDGTKKTVTVSKTAAYNGTLIAVNDPTPVATTAPANGKIGEYCYYTFNIDKNGEYELKAVDYNRQGTGTAINNSNTNAKPVTGGTANTYVANNDTVFIADKTVYTGVKNTPAVAAVNNVYVLSKDTTSNIILAAYTAASGDSKAATTTLVYILDEDAGTGKDADDNTYSIFTAIYEGKKQDIKVNVTGTITEGLYEIKGSTNGYMDLIDTNKKDTCAGKYAYGAAKSNTDISYKSGIITVAGVGAYALAEDAVLYYYNGTSVSTLSTSGLNALSSTNTYSVNLVMKATDNHIVTTAYIVKE